MSDGRLEVLEERLKTMNGKSIAVYMDGIDGDYEYIFRSSCLNIIGIMTRYLVHGEAYGRPFLSFQDLLEKNVAAILMAVKPEYYSIISQRLRRFCIKHQMRLFTAEGEELSLELKKKECARFQQASFWKIEECRKRIHKAEIICFDFQDVLMTYKLLHESDIQDIVFRKMKTADFDKLETADERIELEVRDRLLIGRLDMIRLCRYALANKKRVMIYNNAKLSDTMVKRKLMQYGLRNMEVRKSTIDQKNATDIVYFTNSRRKEKQPQCIYIPNVSEMLEMSPFADKYTEDADLYTRIKTGFFAARAFNSPFVFTQDPDGRMIVSDSYDIGYLFCAEYITDFMIWFVNRLQNADMDYILFGSRDGFLIQELYDMTVSLLKAAKLPKAVYLWISRMVSINIGIHNIEDIKKITEMYFVGKMREMLEKRFFLTEYELLPYDDSYKCEWEYIKAHEEVIIRRCEKVRNQYLSYIRTLALERYEKIAYFDFAASGTCQLFLQEVIGKHLTGFYFYRFESKEKRKMDLDIQAFYGKDISVETNSLFMECVLTAPHATVIAVHADGTPEFMKESRTEDEIEFACNMQEAIKDYYKDVLWLLEDFSDIKIKQLEKNSFCKYMYDDYSVIKNKTFCDYIVKDEFINIESHMGMLYVHD